MSIHATLREDAKNTQEMMNRCMAIIRPTTGIVIIPITVNIRPNIVKKILSYDWIQVLIYNLLYSFHRLQ